MIGTKLIPDNVPPMSGGLLFLDKPSNYFVNVDKKITCKPLKAFDGIECRTIGC